MFERCFNWRTCFGWADLPTLCLSCTTSQVRHGATQQGNVNERWRTPHIFEVQALGGGERETTHAPALSSMLTDLGATRAWLSVPFVRNMGRNCLVNPRRAQQGGDREETTPSTHESITASDLVKASIGLYLNDEFIQQPLGTFINNDVGRALGNACDILKDAWKTTNQPNLWRREWSWWKSYRWKPEVHNSQYGIIQNFSTWACTGGFQPMKLNLK